MLHGLCSLLVLASLTAPLPLSAQAAPDANEAWTLDGAFAQLALSPRDPYLQFVVMQLGRREGKIDRCATEIDRLNGRARRGRAVRAGKFL